MAMDIRHVRVAAVLVVVAALCLYVLTDPPAGIAVAFFLGVMVAGRRATHGSVPSAHRPVGGHGARDFIATGLSRLNARRRRWCGPCSTRWSVVRRHPLEEIADVLRFASYVPLFLALLVVHRRTRTGVTRIDVDFLVDAATIVVVSLLCFWSLSFDAIVLDYTTSPLEAAVVGSYPIADALLLAVALRIFVTRSARATIGVPLPRGSAACGWPPR